MPAAVETMMYVGEVPWHGIGTRLERGATSEEAIKAAGLDWEVEQVPVWVQSPEGVLKQVTDYVANVRAKDGKVLGLVSTRYQVVQNREAFEWADALLGEGVQYETAGSLFGGRRVWLLARLPRQMDLLGDELVPYFCLMNSHDGSSSVRVCVTPVRVVCQNTLSLAFRKAKRTWAVRHTSSIRERLAEARQSLALVNRYLEDLNEWAASMARKRLSHSEWTQLVNKLIPIPQARKGNEWLRELAFERRRWLQKCIEFDHLERFRFNRWGIRGYTVYAAINAVVDFVQHVWVIRKRYDGEEELAQMQKEWLERRANGILDGETLIQQALRMVG